MADNINVSSSVNNIVVTSNENRVIISSPGPQGPQGVAGSSGSSTGGGGGSIAVANSNNVLTSSATYLNFTGGGATLRTMAHQ